VTNRGCSALSFATRKGHAAVVQLLTAVLAPQLHQSLRN